MLCFGKMTRRILVEGREEALRKMIELGEEIRNSFENEEEYLAYEHWVNNPLIRPLSKYDMINEFEARTFEEGRKHERKLILAELRKDLEEQYDDLEIIKKEISEQINSLNTSDLEGDRVTTFLYISGLSGAIHTIKVMGENEQG